MVEAAAPPIDAVAATAPLEAGRRRYVLALRAGFFGMARRTVREDVVS
jgi:hypothetical protein